VEIVNIYIEYIKQKERQIVALEIKENRVNSELQEVIDIGNKFSQEVQMSAGKLYN
jgi:hypothetical protein